MSKIPQKDRKLIKKYARLKGKITPDIRLSDLLDVYEEADPSTRLLYKLEMLAYLKAIKEADDATDHPILQTKS